VEEAFDAILVDGQLLVLLVAVDEPLDGDAGDGRFVGAGDLRKLGTTLYFSVVTSLTINTSVSSDSLGARRSLRSTIICL
jgi:hypothetical protein